MTLLPGTGYVEKLTYQRKRSRYIHIVTLVAEGPIGNCTCMAIFENACMIAFRLTVEPCYTTDAMHILAGMRARTWWSTLAFVAVRPSPTGPVNRTTSRCRTRIYIDGKRGRRDRTTSINAARPRTHLSRSLMQNNH